MPGASPKLTWRLIALLAGVAVLILGVGLAVALRSPDRAPAESSYPDLALQGKRSDRVAWEQLSVATTWDGTKAGAIPEDLRAVYRGQPLFELVGLVDDDDPTSFNTALAKEGYTIRLVAADGYSADMDSRAIVGQGGWIVARLKNDQPLPDGEGPYRDVGSFIRPLSGKLSVKGLTRIELIF